MAIAPFRLRDAGTRITRPAAPAPRPAAEDDDMEKKRKRGSIIKANATKATPGRAPLGNPTRRNPNADTTLPYWNSVEDIQSRLLERAFTTAGAIEPPYDLRTMVELLQASSILAPCIDAYATNIEGYGHRFEPIIDLEKDDADETVADLIRVERLIAREDPIRRANPDVQALPIDPTDAEVVKRRETIRLAMRIEKLKLESFFDSVSVIRSFVALRRKKREDQEAYGNAYWELIRDAEGKPQQLVHVPSYTVRLLRSELNPSPRTYKIRGPDLKYQTIEQPYRFRQYVQILSNLAQPVVGGGAGYLIIYFKEFGDPRIYSSYSGRQYDTIDDLRRLEPGIAPATELVHFPIGKDPRWPYGVPRWIGALLPVFSTRYAEQINHDYFTNKGLPDWLAYVSGGQFTKESLRRWEDFWKNKVQGAENFNKGLILEASPFDDGAPDAAARARIEIKSLGDHLRKDGLFMEYSERNADIIGMNFRLPRIIRGDIRDFNRATAFAALEYTEAQVFGPERDDFDFWMDRYLFPEMGIRFWKFVSNGPPLRSPEGMIDMQDRGREVLTVNERRGVLSEAMGQEFRRIDEPWADRPAQEGAGDAAAAGTALDDTALTALARQVLDGSPT